jgi:hypothetical protein
LLSETVAAYRTRQHMEIDIATIEKGSDYLGMVASIPPEDQFTRWRSEFCGYPWGKACRSRTAISFPTSSGASGWSTGKRKDPVDFWYPASWSTSSGNTEPL